MNFGYILMSNNDSHVMVNSECFDWVCKFFPTYLKINQYSGAPYKTKQFILIAQAMECAEYFNKPLKLNT
jgi:penicillin V acylase-like amidase (Ntn superfamily)